MESLRLTRSLVFVALGSERAKMGTDFGMILFTIVKNFNKPAKAAWCLYDAITTYIIRTTYQKVRSTTGAFEAPGFRDRWF